MADPFANFDPFAKSQDDAASAAPAASSTNAQDPFANFDPFAGQPGNEQTSKTGAFVRSFVGGIAPAAGAIRGGTLGMEAGAAIGEMLFPAGGGIPGGAIGGVVGLLGGAYGGGWAAGTAQNYALNRIPKFRDMLGQSEEQKRLDEQEHPVVSFMGGMAPYAITMSPMAGLPKTLPENATNWQRLLANKYTSRFMSAGVVGGMQLGQEVASEDKINWNRVAIATAFGLAFNKSNSIGEAISEFGAKPIRRVFGLPSPVFARTERPPTIAETNESVAGPGLTEPVFMGEESRPDAAALAATKDVGIEQTILNPRQQDLENRARQTEPDLFAEYDALRGRQQTFRNWIESQNEPKPFQFLDLEEQRADLEKQLAEHVASRNGYTGGPEARSLRAKIRGVQAEHDALAERSAAFQAGTAAETPDIAEARKHLMATDEALRDIQPKIRNAYQAAAEYTGAPSIAPPPPEVAAPPEAIATETPAGAPEPGTTAEAATPQAVAPAIAAQKDLIAKDWSQQLVAAGRPQEEADLAGRLLATQYAAYSSWFGGTRGSPLELYKREGPKVIAGRLVGASTAPRGASLPELPPNPTQQEASAYLAAVNAAGGKVAAAPRGGIVPPPVEAEPPAIAVKARAPRIIPPEKQSLFQFLASRGGLKAEPDTLAILGKASYSVPGFGNLVRENGMSIDRALEAATEAGYLTDAARERGGVTEVRPEDLRALMDEEARGNKQYREGIAPPTKPIDVEEEEYQRQAAQGQPEAETEPLAHLSQQDVIDFFQGQRGAIRFTQGMRDVITLLRGEGGANASTIIHELGHHFLKMFMTAARTDDAPQWMRDASGTITRDLRIASADVLDEVRKDGSPTARARKAHEQFARTYEQYLFEGRAPSPELATVFQRFRAWMQDIYDSVRGLGITISPEMRTVLDRMHVAETEPTVVGPTHPRGPTLTEIHEADAKTIEPAEAEPAADRVAAERDRDAQEQPPEIKLGIEAKAAAAGIEVPKPEGAEPAGQGGEVAGRPGEVVGGGGATEPVAAGIGVRHEPGAVEPGGGNAGAEGAAVPGGTAGGRGGEQSEHPLAPRPAADSLPPRETDLNDLAGNIRTRNLTDVEKAREAMMTLARKHQDFMEVRGGRITDEMAWQFASELGRNPAEMDLPALKVHLEKLFGVEDASPGMLAGRQMIKQMSEDVAKLSSVADEAKTPESLYNLAQAISRLEMGMNMLAPATASAGRTLRALRDISGTEGKDAKAIQKILKENTGRTLFQMAGIARLISKYDRSSQVNKFVSDSRLHPYRMIVEIWINGLISGLQTHATYGVGNTITSLERIGPDTAAAALIGAVRNKLLGREGDTVSIGEVAAGLKGLWQGIAPSALSALQSAETGTTTLLHKGEQTRFIQPLSATDTSIASAVLDQAAKWSDVQARLFGLSTGLRDGVVAAASLAKAGGTPGAPALELLPTRGATPDILAYGVRLPTGEIARAPSRMIAAIHSFFRPLNYIAHISQLALRDADNHPVAGVPRDTQIANFRSNPPQWAIDEAIGVSNKATLMDQGGEFTRKLSAFVNHEFLGKKDPETGKLIPGTGLPILKFIDPFIHISTNIINWGIVEHTPVGILSPSIRADLMGKNGTIAADTAAGRMLAGTALSLLFGFLAAEGYVTGSGPSNPDDAALWRQVYQPHSVRIGDTWYAMNRLGPMGMLLSTAADLYDVAPHLAEGEMAKAAAALGHAVAQNILDESFMRGPSDLIKAIDQPDRYGPAYVRNFVASFIPFSTQMRYMAQTADPYSRQARTIADTVRRGIPGLSMDLMPRRDPWGEPMPSRSALGGNLTAIWEQRVNADPTNQALVELGVHVGMPRRSILNVKLTDEQYDDYSRIAGRLAKMRMDAIVRSPSFRQMPPGTRQDYVNEQLKQSRAVAQGMLFQKYPSILVDAHAAKMAKRTGQAP